MEVISGNPYGLYNLNGKYLIYATSGLCSNSHSSLLASSCIERKNLYL